MGRKRTGPIPVVIIIILPSHCSSKPVPMFHFFLYPSLVLTHKPKSEQMKQRDGTSLFNDLTVALLKALLCCLFITKSLT